MGALMRAMDWSATALGPLSDWPQSLRTMVSTCLNSRFPLLVWWGADMVMLYNDAYRAILGDKHPRAMGQRGREPWAEIWHIIGPMLEGVLTRGEATWSENQFLPIHRHGFTEETYFTFSYSPIREEGGGVGGIFTAVAETTAQVLDARRITLLQTMAARTTGTQSIAECCARAMEALAEDASDIPFAALYLLDAPGTAAHLTAHTPFRADGPTWPQEVLLTGDPEAPWPFASVVRTGQPARVEGLQERFGALPSHEGRPTPTSALVLPVARPGDARPAALLVVGLAPLLGRDPKYRAFLDLVAGNLATSLASARSYEEETRRAEALAELDRAKTAFFNNVSHEFRTPLTLMLGPVEDGLADTEAPLPPPQRERQERVRRNGLRLQKLVNALLDFARIEAGRAQASFVPTDLSALTADLVSSFDSAMTSAGLRLAVDCPPLPEAIHVDPTMWEKVVLNLVSNAFKFTFEGEIRVALKWEGSRVEFTVQDTGVGIPEEELPRLFNRFHRVEGVRSRSHEGTGIGLALVQELVKLHGGTVGVRSAPGTGTTFTVSLPTGSAHLPARHGDTDGTRVPPRGGPEAFLAELFQWTGDGASPPPAAATPTSVQARARILLADDNADMRDYLTRLLAPRWSVETAAHGLQALEAARANPPDLILSDVMMPGMNGTQLVQALRADKRTRTIPVVLLSARAGEEATIEGLRSGADAYLVKPFSANELVARVESQLTVSRLRQDVLQAERTHVEETTRLLEASRLATRSREETLAVVSHDLRSPLTAIGTAAEMLQRALGHDERETRLRRHTDSIRRSVGRMNMLIADLLDLASIDAGTLSIDVRPQTVEELVREARELFEPQATDKGLRFTVDLEPGRVLRCDKERILQTLGNLLSNAIKFTPPGGSVGLRVEAEPGTRGVRFGVTDTGPGISEEAQARIFDRYWHAAQKQREGHGLGLAIAKGIVEGHGGRLWVESAEGRGSTFWVSLPAEPRAQAVTREASPVQRQPPRKPGRDEAFIQSGGEMGSLLRAHDWSTNSLGPLEDWPQSLRTSVSTMLRSPYPIILFWGPELRMLYNDPFRPILGAKHPQTVGARGNEALAEEWGQLGPLMMRVHETGEPLFIENGNVNFARRPGGLREESYFTWSYNPTIGESGEIAGLFAIASEATRQVVGDRRLAILRELSIRTALDKKVEAIFRSLEEVLAHAAHDLPFALFYVVREDKARLVSCAGLARGVAAAPLEVLPDDAASWPLASVALSRQEALVDDLATRFGPLPGGPWPEPTTRALVLPVPMGAESETTGVLVAGLSPLRALDDEYRGFLQLLARQLAASVSSARAYEQEKQRAEELAQLDEAKTAFFSNVSHEFRTPLTLILGPVEDALSRAGQSLEGEQLDLVRRNALRLYKMVNTLLDFSRMEAGRAQASYVPTDLSTLTTSLVSAFQSAVESAGLKLVVDCPPLPEPIYVDPDMWEKVVLNLLSNAVKYTYQGEIRVRLQWQDAQAVLTVQDTGVGIPEEELPRVFERFYRVRVTQGRSHEGTGIGLALVQELVKLHGGTVAVESRFGEGTTFTLRMPKGFAHLPPDRVERQSPPRVSAVGAAPFVEEAHRWSAEVADLAMQDITPSRAPVVEMPAELARSRILLVDDNADLRAYVAGLLRQGFQHIETATDGLDALERVRVQPPDLILSDVMMPRMDGFGLVRALRADERTRAIPIILLSARAGDESTVEGLQTGADDYLVKPFSSRELLVRVRTQLDMARVRRKVIRNEFEKEALRESVRVRDEFLRLVSHELRTPVSALSLNVQGLSREAQAEASPAILRVKARTTEKQLHRLSRLVEQLVDVSEFVTGPLELTREDVDLSQVATTVVEQSREKAARAECLLTVKAPVPVVGHYDPARLHQLIDCLIDNALKFAAGKPVEVTVERTGDQAALTVVDHGEGIGPEDQERIFGRFERAVPANHHGGFGLGLWIARHIAEAHAGSIRLAPTEGGGATFTLVLPLDAA
ncbi:ATP-binding protein [Corallococcus sp. bb12-1]|uniref:ATP-binding protein n=1 Tax=Corallococcus sp. bb12-1 TaxID=2996784 RepID=UPI00226D6705|nr:ATP-binding protein [Corallococcus sp. bb12-1]MCY1044918.1 ATP-binding protein [Corallococcus sp. bb12-1]